MTEYQARARGNHRKRNEAAGIVQLNLSVLKSEIPLIKNFIFGLRDGKPLAEIRKERLAESCPELLPAVQSI